MIKIIDNFIPEQWQNDLAATLLSHRFPWYYSNDVTFEDNSKLNHPAMFHVFCNEQQINSPFYDNIYTLTHFVPQHIDKNVIGILQSRAFLQFPLSASKIQNRLDSLHVDLARDHVVLLYYVIDSDGDTIIVDHKMGDDYMIYDDLHHEDYNIIEKISPKKGRAVIFDGRYYHTAQQPKENIRCVINFDMVTT